MFYKTAAFINQYFLLVQPLLLTKCKSKGLLFSLAPPLIFEGAGHKYAPPAMLVQTFVLILQKRTPAKKRRPKVRNSTRSN